MRKIFTLLLFIALAGLSNAQEGTVPDDLLIEHRWYDGQTRNIFDHPTTQVYGQRVDTKNLQNVGEITNVGYFSLNQVLENVGARWKKQGLSSELANAAADSLRRVVPGGFVYLYIERFLENRANLQYFFIIIRDKDDKTLYTKYFKYKAPSLTAVRSTWWNYIVTEIPVEVQYPFYIYVNDKQSSFLSDFKFKIEDVTINPKNVEVDPADSIPLHKSDSTKHK